MRTMTTTCRAAVPRRVGVGHGRDPPLVCFARACPQETRRQQTACLLDLPRDPAETSRSLMHVRSGYESSALRHRAAHSQGAAKNRRLEKFPERSRCEKKIDKSGGVRSRMGPIWEGHSFRAHARNDAGISAKRTRQSHFEPKNARARGAGKHLESTRGRSWNPCRSGPAGSRPG